MKAGPRAACRRPFYRITVMRLRDGLPSMELISRDKKTTQLEGMWLSSAYHSTH
jgi:hypothetical protein